MLEARAERVVPKLRTRPTNFVPSNDATCKASADGRPVTHARKRDGGRCAFVGTHGRCTERGFLEFHHVVPYADGGATVAENLELRCRAHNIYEAEKYFGCRLPLLVREAGGPRYRWRLGPDRGHEHETTSHVSAKSQRAPIHPSRVQVWNPRVSRCDPMLVGRTWTSGALLQSSSQACGSWSFDGSPPAARHCLMPKPKAKLALTLADGAESAETRARAEGAQR